MWVFVWKRKRSLIKTTWYILSPLTFCIHNIDYCGVHILSLISLIKRGLSRLSCNVNKVRGDNSQLYIYPGVELQVECGQVDTGNTWNISLLTTRWTESVTVTMLTVELVYCCIGFCKHFGQCSLSGNWSEWWVDYVMFDIDMWVVAGQEKTKLSLIKVWGWLNLFRILALQ